MSDKKELKELFKALGYCGGEIKEISEDGIGLEDLKSIKDVIENKDMLGAGFKVEGDFKEHLKGILDFDSAIEIIASAKEGWDLGKE